MWRSKKFIIGAVLAAVVLAGSLGGVALAQTESASDGAGKTLLARVAEILGIEQQTLEDAFAQARTDMRDEALQKLVDEGKITSEQAEQYKTWLQARPDMEPFRQRLNEWQQLRPEIPSELKEWLEASPDMPFRFGFKGFGGFRGMGGMRGFGGPCAPAE
jgi:hypothetical protein